MEIYIINTDYINYLRKFDKRVMINEEDGSTRKYVGIVFQIGSFNYFVPLSSPKEESDYVIIKNVKRVRKSVVPIHRIIVGSGNNENFLGKLKFSSMIPVIDSELSLLDVENIKDNKYKLLIQNQIRYIRKNKQLLEENHARVLYNQKSNNYKDIKYLQNTVDFKLLEQKYQEYKTIQEVIIDGQEQHASSKED